MISNKSNGILYESEFLRNPQHNRSAVFAEDERETPGLIGFLPAGIDTEDTQVGWPRQQTGNNPTDLERYSGHDAVRKGEL